MNLTDAYAHVGVPRFQSVYDYRTMAAAAGIGRSVLCSFDSCPDLAAIHAAIERWPDTYRGLGVPLGGGRTEIEAGCRAQLAAGFSGLRLSDGDVIERPWLLEVLAEAGGIAVVCGQASAPACAAVLAAHLERHERAVVIGGHFAGVAEVSALSSGAVAALFAHPRFFVVFSRHGASQPDVARAWGEAVVARTGWARVMWGSEAPVLFWRNETLDDAIAWVDQLAPSEAERAGFFRENADRLYFAEAARVAPLRMPFEPWDRARGFPATIWARGVPVEASVAGRLVHGWISDGGSGSLGAYMAEILDGALPPLPKDGDV